MKQINFIPCGFQYDSNYNDMSVSAYCSDLHLRLFIDSEKPEDREDPEIPRYGLFGTDHEGYCVALIAESEVFSDITKIIEQIRERLSGGDQNA